MDTSVPPAQVAPALTVAPARSDADRFVRRLLFLDPEAPKVSILGAESAFQKSIAISAIRCLITYIALPLLRPVVDLSGGVGPVLGLVVGTVSMVAIVFAARRFFAADHKWRWGYGAIGGSILVLLTWQAVVDVRALIG